MEDFYPLMIMHDPVQLDQIAKTIIQTYQETGQLNFSIDIEEDLDELELQYIEDYIQNIIGG